MLSSTTAPFFNIYHGLVATSTTLGVNLSDALFNAVFTVIRALLPYGVGIVVLVICIGIAWRLIRSAHRG